nr:translocation/assembly module TamB domain-containing protein [Acidobacteriota bacterium]
VRMSGELADYRYLSADVTVDKADLRFFDYPLQNDGPMHITFGDNTLHVGRFKLAGEDTQLDVAGDVSLTDEQVNIKAAGRANLAILQAFFSDLRSSGAAEITADITGDMLAPQFAGSATIAGGRVRHFALPHSFEDVNGRVLFDVDGLRLDGVRGKLGGGDVLLGGTIGLKGYRPDELNLTATGRNMTLRYPEGFQSRLNADLAVRGTMAAAELSGTVNVLHATMTRELDSEAGLFGLAAAESATSSSGTISTGVVETGIPLTYEVQILAPQTLRLDSALAHVVASGDLTVRGTYDHPEITGRVDINRGEAIFQGNRYQVTRGAVEFTNPTTMIPVFDIEAETRIRVPSGNGFQYGQVYRVNIQIAGTTERLTPVLSSDPQLPQIDIVSLLFGETDPTKLNEAELRTLDASRANLNLLQASAARLLTSPLSAQVGKVVERTLGVDTVQITPLLGFSDTAQLSPTARVTLGKRVSDRVFVTYTRALNTGRAEVILLEYDQSETVSWVLSKNEDQSFALDFRVRHRF